MAQRIYDPRQQRQAQDIAAAPVGAQVRVQRIESTGHTSPVAYDQVARNRLLPSPEECANQEDPVTPGALMQALEELLANDPAFTALMPSDGARHDLMRIFLALPLTPPLAYKLTLARDQRPELLDHSLRAAYCAAALAEHCRMAQHEIVNAAAAGLFHDLGLLHVDPGLLNTSQPLHEHELHYLYAHPLTAYLILEHTPIWHPIVSTAVLEHHERIDGSGYPMGHGGDRLGSLGQLLAVAELAATVLAYPGTTAARNRLGIVLRMNEGKLNHEYCSHLLAMFPPSSSWGVPSHAPGVALETLVGLSVALLRWQAIGAQLPQAPMASLINKRVGQLGHSLAEVGIDLEYWSTFSMNADLEAAALAEMNVAAREGVWQLHAIGYEVCRRWEQLIGGSEPIAAAVLDWLRNVENIPLA